MVTLAFDMDRESFKPKIVSSDYPDLTLLLDTGADTPVWCMGERIFKAAFPMATELKHKFVLSGFGTGVEIAKAFSIPEFVLSDGKQSITYQNMVVAVTKRPSINVSLILSASLFHHAEITIDRLKSVVYPTLTVTSNDKMIPVFYRRRELSDRQRELLGLEESAIIADIYAEDEEGDT